MYSGRRARAAPAPSCRKTRPTRPNQQIVLCKQIATLPGCGDDSTLSGARGRVRVWRVRRGQRRRGTHRRRRRHRADVGGRAGRARRPPSCRHLFIRRKSALQPFLTRVDSACGEFSPAVYWPGDANTYHVNLALLCVSEFVGVSLCHKIFLL